MAAKRLCSLLGLVGGPAPWLVTMVFGRDEQESRSC